MDRPDVPAWDPATYFEAPGGAMLVRPTGPCGDEACRAVAWAVVRLDYRDRPATWTVCARCATEGRLLTWKAVGPTVEVLGTYDLALGGPRWLPRPARADKWDLLRHAGESSPAPAPNRARTRPARQATLLETA